MCIWVLNVLVTPQSWDITNFKNDRSSISSLYFNSSGLIIMFFQNGHCQKTSMKSHLPEEVYQFDWYVFSFLLLNLGRLDSLNCKVILCLLEALKMVLLSINQFYYMIFRDMDG